MKTTHTCIFGDARKMSDVAGKSVHLVVTSPPYWQLKDYGSEEQIGFNDSYEDYINNLNLVWNECYRVLHDGCRMVINIGDQFARSVYYGRYKVIPIRTEIIRFCETIGFDYMGAIIWQKRTTMNTTGGATIMGSYPFPRNGIIELDYEFILIFKKPGKAPVVSKEVKEQSRLTKERWRECFSGHWHFAGERQNGHLAMFPVELPKRCIEMFTFVGETVFDPFMGSGTTAIAAYHAGRNSLGYEINADFTNNLSSRFTEIGMPAQAGYNLYMRSSRQPDFNVENEIDQLPCRFHDPVKCDCKNSVQHGEFGSKIKSTDKRREEYFKVKNILSPVLIQLNDGRRIRLLGLKPKPDVNSEATEYLKLKLDKSSIYLRFDEVTEDGEDNVLAYVYMKNRTFINAQLVKRGLVDVDEGVEFGMKGKFKNLVLKK